MASSLDTRYCGFDKDHSSGNLGQRNLDDIVTRTKLTHTEFLGCGIIATVSCLAYGTWQGQPAALLVLLFRLRASEGHFRLRRAELSLSFASSSPNGSHPVICQIRPKSNRVAKTTPLHSQPSSISASSTASSVTQTLSSSALWPPENYTIFGNAWLGKANEQPHQALWRLAEPSGSSLGICESIPLSIIVTYSGPFQAVIRASGSTFGNVKVQTFPWSRDEPLLFDGVTGKGWGVGATEFSGFSDEDLDEFMFGRGSNGPLAHSKPSSSVQSETQLQKVSDQSSKVYRAQGIPPNFSGETLTQVISTILSLPKDHINVKFVSQACNTAIVSFSSAPAEIPSHALDQAWQIHVPPGEASESTPPMPQVKIQFDRGFLGFTDLGLGNALPDANVDIIAVHGLGGHAYGSYKQRGGDYMWLADSLPFDLAQVQILSGFVRPRILGYGYDAHVDGSNSFQSIEDLAIELKLLLRETRRTDPNRPVIFIGHSLGGLMVKELLIQLASETNAIDAANFRSTIGLLFFGVPNRGMDIGELLAIIKERPNTKFLESLSIGSEFLKRQAEIFPESFNSREAVVYSFYETCTSNTAKMVNGKLTMTGDPVVLVEMDSATHSRPWEMEGTSFRVPIRRSHADMVKFEQYSQDYIMVRSCIREIINRHFGEGTL